MRETAETRVTRNPGTFNSMKRCHIRAFMDPDVDDADARASHGDREYVTHPHTLSPFFDTSRIPTPPFPLPLQSSAATTYAVTRNVLSYRRLRRIRSLRAFSSEALRARCLSAARDTTSLTTSDPGP